MQKVLRIGIVGAGTAGLATALAFSKRGHSVTLFEKHASLLPLGAGLLIQPLGLAAIEKLGLGEAFADVSVPIQRLYGTSHRDWKLVDVPYAKTPARAVSRAALSKVLLDAVVSTDTQIQYASPIDSVSVEEGQAKLNCLSNGYQFDLVVIADGTGSILPAQVDLAVNSRLYKWGALWGMFDVENWYANDCLLQRYSTTRKMYGLMPTAKIDGKTRLSLFWSLPSAQYEAWKAQPLEVWKAELLDLWPESAPVVNQIVRHDQVAFASYRHARAKTLANGPVCVIGDAAHSMSPQLGLGTTLAVQDALALAELVHALGPVKGAQMYSQKRLRLVRTYQALSCALTPCFQADSAGLWRDVLFASLLKVPGTRKIMHYSVAG